MRVLCVARHPFLSEHLCRYFGRLGAQTVPCVGVREAIDCVAGHRPDVIVCDYDLLATTATLIEHELIRTDVPVIAVSLTRQPGDAHVLEHAGVAGFLYLPTLELEDAHRLLAAARRKGASINPPNVLSWPGNSPAAQLS